MLQLTRLTMIIVLLKLENFFATLKNRKNTELDYLKLITLFYVIKS